MSHYYRPTNGFTAYGRQHFAMQAVSLEIDLRKLAGQVETDSVLRSLPAQLSGPNLCLALEAEITYWTAKLDEPYAEFFQVEAEDDCQPEYMTYGL
jgi:hypothetical protein